MSEPGVGIRTSTASEVSACRAVLGDILVAHALRVHPRWLDAIAAGEPDGGVRGRLDVLVDAVELAGADEWLLRAWIIGAEPGEDSPADMIREGDLGTARCAARAGLFDPQRMMTQPLAGAKAAMETIERSGLSGLGWLQSHLEALRALITEHEQLLRNARGPGDGVGDRG